MYVISAQIEASSLTTVDTFAGPCDVLSACVAVLMSLRKMRFISNKTQQGTDTNHVDDEPINSKQEMFVKVFLCRVGEYGKECLDSRGQSLLHACRLFLGSKPWKCHCVEEELVEIRRTR